MECKISLSKSEILFTSDDHSSEKTVVLFLPGISGKAHSERFLPLVHVCSALQLPIARISAWEGEVDVQTKTWSYFHEMLDEVIVYLLEHKYTKIIAVGKSFGGGLLLSYHNKNIVKKILWAPAIGVGEVDTFTEYTDVPLSQVSSLLNIRLSNSFIHADCSAICIIHGTKDVTIPVENSRYIIGAAQNGELFEIEDADHSFKSTEEEESLMTATHQFLSGDPSSTCVT